jgi:myo-inositol-1(or 4)-monophosphatase
MDDLDCRARFAVDLAVEAGRLAVRMRHGLARAEAKSAIDFCTEADLAVERLIRERLTARFGDAMIGEEDGGAAAPAVWVVDPIDGTTEYIHGTRRWCVSLAFVRDRTIEIGVLYAPDDDCLFVARRGGGALRNGRPMAVSRLAHGAVPVVEVGWSERRPIASFCELVRRMTEAGIEFRRRGSGALGLVDVAAGLSDGYVELHINAWDALAAILLVAEAGGSCNDFLAGDGLAQGNFVLATTPELRQRMSPLLTGLIDP